MLTMAAITDQILPKIEDQDVACYVHMDDSDSGIQNDLSSPEQSSVTDSVKTYASPVNSPEIVEKARPCTLPPCRVCEQRASGFHYGANTCEACKGFFRRSLQRTIDYKCFGNGDCDVGPTKRAICPFCRFKKCLLIGMSKEAIKTGRYTHEKRTRDINEVKKLKNQMMSVTTSKDEDIGSLEHLIVTLVEVHREVDFLTPVLENGLEERQKKYLEQYKLKTEVFGCLPALSKSEYETFFKTTGIDLDDRQKIMDFFAKGMEHGVMRFVTFAKAIPGFTDLPVCDQVNLIKCSRFEFWLIGAHYGLNYDLQVATGSNGVTYHIDEIARVWDPDFLKSLFIFSKGLQKIDMNYDEITLLKGIVVMFTDRCDLQEPEKVDRIQMKLVQCFIHLLRKNHPDEPLILARIFSRLTGLRDLTEWNQRLTSNLTLEWPIIQQTPLLYEILSF